MVTNIIQPDCVTATTQELVTVYEVAHTLAGVLTGLSKACSGPAEVWAKNLIESLYEARGSAATELLTRTDESRMRATALAQSLEWAMTDEDSAALLRVMQDVAARPGVVAL